MATQFSYKLVLLYYFDRRIIKGLIAGLISIVVTTFLVSPAHAQCSPSKAEKLFKQKNFEDTVQLLESCSGKDPSIYFYRGASQGNLGRHELAKEDLTIAVALKPDSHMSWLYLGKAYLFLKDYQQARIALEKAVELKPYDGRSWNDLGVALESLGYTGVALKYYQIALQQKISSSDRKIVLENIKKIQAQLRGYTSSPSTIPMGSSSWTVPAPQRDGHLEDRDSQGYCTTYRNGCND